MRRCAPCQYEHAQVGCEAGQLLFPVPQRTDRCNNQHRFFQPAALDLQRNVRDGLNCLPETHVVGKDSAQAEFAEKLQPAQSLLLVVAQSPVESRVAPAAPEYPKNCARSSTISVSVMSCEVSECNPSAASRPPWLRGRDTVSVLSCFQKLNQSIGDALNALDLDRQIPPIGKPHQPVISNTTAIRVSVTLQ